MMDDGQQPVPTLAEAQAELDNLDTWLKNFASMQQQHGNVVVRVAFLQGVIAASANGVAQPNREQRRRAAAKKVATKSR